MNSSKNDTSFYVRSAFAGGICTFTAHTVLVPIDVIKTRIQINPSEYSGMVSSFKKIRHEEGLKALVLGMGPTTVGYTLQGMAKFGIFEIFKKKISDHVGSSLSQKYKSMIYVSSSTMAELVASFVLCPWEAIRIRMVSQPKLFQQLNTFSGVRLVYRNEGLLGLYKGLGPVCFKQVPYTVTQLTVFSHLVDGFYNSVLPLLSETRRYKNDLSPTEQLAVSTGCGFIAGVASAVTSHPADTVLSIINAKAKGVKTEIANKMPSTVLGILKSLGWKGVWLGLGTRCAMVGTLSAVMFLTYDSAKVIFGLPTSSGIGQDKA